MRHLLIKGRHRPTASAPTHLLVTKLTQYWANPLTDNKGQNPHLEIPVINNIFKRPRSDAVINPRLFLKIKSWCLYNLHY